MSQKPHKPVPDAPKTPAISRGELACAAILLALCVLASAWLGEQADLRAVNPAPAVAAPAPSASTAAAERPGRERPSSRDRQWRDPAATALPNI